MNIARRVLALIGALGIGSAAIPSEATAQETRTPTEIQEEAELQCQKALEENTIEALEEYLRRFPDAPNACRVLALAALGDFGPAGSPGNNPGPGPGGYGG